MINPLEHNISTTTTSLWVIVAGLATYSLWKCVYNLYLHPLARFPGPRLAALGTYYEFYYDVVKDGTYLWEIQKMHKIYGMDTYIEFICSSLVPSPKKLCFKKLSMLTPRAV